MYKRKRKYIQEETLFIAILFIILESNSICFFILHVKHLFILISPKIREFYTHTHTHTHTCKYIIILIEIK